jgi:hypothetical protein
MRSRLTIALLSVSCARSSTETRVFPLPQESGSALIALESGGKVAIRAYDLDPVKTTVGLPSLDVLHAGTSVTALLYDGSLAGIGIQPGTVASSTDATAVPLPAWSHVDRLDPDASGAKAWVAEASPSSAVAGFRIPGPKSPCARFDANGVSFPNVTTFFGLPIDGESALVSTEADVYRVHRDGTWTMIQVRPAPPAPLTAGTIDAAGEYWFCNPAAVGSGSEIRRGHMAPDGGLDLALARTTTAACPGSMAAGPTSGGFEVYFAEYSGDLFRVSESSVRLLHVFPSPPMSQTKGGVVLLAPGSVAAVHAGSAYVFFADNGVVHTEMPGAADLTTLSNMSGYGLVAADLEGQVFQRQNGSWTTLVKSDIAGFAIYALSPYLDGFLYSGKGGFVAEYTAKMACSDAITAGFRSVLHIVALGSDALLLYDTYDTKTNPLSILHRR